MRRQEKIASLAILLFFIIQMSSGLAVLKKGDKFFPFSLKGVDEKIATVKLEEGKLTLTAEFVKDGQKIIQKSHPNAILIDFWATWCVPCRAAMPYMQKLYEKFKPQQGQTEGGLELFGVALDHRGSVVVRPFYQKLKVTYPMLADPTTGADDLIRMTKEMGEKYKVQEIPVVYLIDSKGTLVHVHEGFKKEHIAELEKEIGHLVQAEIK